MSTSSLSVSVPSTSQIGSESATLKNVEENYKPLFNGIAYGREDWFETIEKVCEADVVDETVKSMFPLSERPWAEPLTNSFVSACPSYASPLLPPTSLLAEARCMVKIAEMERAVRVAEAEVFRLRAKENSLKAHLFKIQAAMECRLLQISDNRIGHIRAEQERLSCNWPPMIDNLKALQQTGAV